MRRSALWGVAALLAGACAAVADTIPIVTNALGTVTWVEDTSGPVYNPPGKAYYPTVVERGGTYTMWSENATGEQMATSTDGINWTTIGQVTGLQNPAHAVVEDLGGTYRIWYWSGQIYSIGAIRTATSSNGLDWSGDTAIAQAGTTVITGRSSSDWNYGSYGPEDILYNPAGSAALVDPKDPASVWKNRYVMYYDGDTGGHESIGLAVSSDGVTWTGYQGGAAPVLNSSSSGWDSGYVGYGTVIRVGANEFDLYYSGGTGSTLNQGIGFATSTDGIDWVKSGSNPIFSIFDGVNWREERTYTPMVIGDQMWFTGVSSNGTYAIDYAYAEPEVPEPATLGAGMLGMLLALLAAFRRGRAARC